MRVLIIDNYDSFTFNLFQALGEITGVEPIVVRNDEVAWEELVRLAVDCVVISPGPGRPERERDFGLSRRVLLELNFPILGVCLGHQGICDAFGGAVVRSGEPMHGRISSINHDGSELFGGVPNPFAAMRYHSLECARPLPDVLRETAWTADGVVMGLAHRERPIWGVQFHPESVATEHGRTILKNFVEMARRVRRGERWKCFWRRVEKKVDAERVFRSMLAGEEYAFWLDSSMVSEQARFSFLGGGSGADVEVVQDLGELRQKLAARVVPDPGLPFDFCCGYVGYFEYELSCRLLFAGRCLAIDHMADVVYLLYAGRDGDRAAAEDWFDGVDLEGEDSRVGEYRHGDFSFRCGRKEYLALIERCLEKIREGESYEICLTNSLRAEFAGDPLEAYVALRRLNAAPYAAYLKFPAITAACSSPERFLKVRPDKSVDSKPIKGTIRRGSDPNKDATLRERLAGDPKSRAENLMIVDLVRNDLGKVCEIGSVVVESLMDVEAFSNVHQMVSTIKGKLRQDCGAVEAFEAAFPGGSMTGAPKMRTMEIIKELECEPRESMRARSGISG